MNMFETEKILGEDYLITEIGLQEIGYEEQMIRKLENKDILLCKTEYFNGIRRLCYRISGLVKFESFLRDNPLKKEDMIEYIVQLRQITGVLEGYMLDFNNVYLGKDGLYIDHRMHRLKFCIVPSVKSINGQNDFIRLLMQNIDIEDAEALRLSFNIFKNDPEFKLGINDIFRLIENQRPVAKPDIVKQEAEVYEISDEPEEINVSEKTNLSDAAYYKEPPVAVPTKKIDSKNKAKDNVKDKAKAKVGVKGLMVRIFTSLAFITAAMFIFSVIKGREAAEKVFVPYLILAGSVTLYHIVGGVAGAIKNRAGKAEESDMDSEATGYCLVPKNKRDEKINMTYFPFLIGSKSGITDFRLGGPDIEAVHLRIEETESGLTVTDLDTESGTYINGIKTEKGKSRAVSELDEIKIGNHEYTLRCL